MVKDSILMVRDAFLTKIRNQAGMSALTTSVQPYTRGSSSAIRQEKEIKSIHIGKEKGKLSLFTEIVIYREEFIESTEKLLELVGEFNKVSEY